ncbi:hypothetical protein [Eudoraea sp.]|uniref:hypothetical protein n=1 Tax=Eudoraea sp. TaxID=1979955 RepID=UPI003C78F01C
MKKLENYGIEEMNDSSLKLIYGGSGAGNAIGVFLGSLVRYGGGYMGGVTFVTDYARYRAMK